MVTTASGRPSRPRMRSARYSRVSRCSVKMMILRTLPSASLISSLSLSRSRSSVHFRSVPEWRTRLASSSRSRRRLISLSSSATVLAVVAASATSDSISSASPLGRSSRSSVSSGRSRPSSSARRRLSSGPSRLSRALRTHLAASALQPLAPAFQRLQDRLRAGRQSALQHGEREADGEAAPPVALLLEPVGAVHLLADVLGDRLVQFLLVRGER